MLSSSNKILEQIFNVGPFMHHMLDDFIPPTFYFISPSHMNLNL